MKNTITVKGQLLKVKANGSKTSFPATFQVLKVEDGYQTEVISPEANKGGISSGRVIKKTIKGSVNTLNDIMATVNLIFRADMGELMFPMEKAKEDSSKIKVFSQLKYDHKYIKNEATRLFIEELSNYTYNTELFKSKNIDGTIKEIKEKYSNGEYTVANAVGVILNAYYYWTHQGSYGYSDNKMFFNKEDKKEIEKIYFEPVFILHYQLLGVDFANKMKELFELAINNDNGISIQKLYNINITGVDAA